MSEDMIGRLSELAERLDALDARVVERAQNAAVVRDEYEHRFAKLTVHHVDAGQDPETAKSRAWIGTLEEAQMLRDANAALCAAKLEFMSAARQCHVLELRIVSRNGSAPDKARPSDAVLP